MAKFLEVKNLNVKLGDTLILENVNFEVDKGEAVAILGPNGAGKTVLFRALLGLLPYEGKISWHEKPNFGYVPQRFEYDQTFPLTVEELFSLKEGSGFWFRKAPFRPRIEKALEKVGMAKMITRQVGKLSSGHLQRILIAYALWGNPNILLFDEPTAGVDIKAEATIYELLHQLALDFHLTVLMISHDLNVIYQSADRVLCLNKAVLCYGVPLQVLTPEKLAELYHAKTSFFQHEHPH